MAPAPEGERLLLIEGGGREVWVNKGMRLANADGSDIRTLVASNEAGPLSMAWSPDERQIAYAAGPGIMLSEAYDRREEALAGRRIWVMSADGMGKKQLTDDPAYADEQPMWSAEGKYLAFVRRSVAGGPAEVWAYNLHTHQPPYPMAGDLPLPGEYYGYFRWASVLDWHAGSVAPPSPATAAPTHMPTATLTPTPEPTPTEVAKGLTITILYDNNEYDERLETAWGFSCLVEGLENTILFDRGGDSSMLLRNMRKLEIDPQDVEAIVISHIDADHLGGLAGFLEENQEVTVYLPAYLPESIKDTVRKSGAELVEVHEPTTICERAHSTGELGDWIKEQSLVIETNEGLVVITGCAHPGVANVIREAKRQLKEDVHLVLGGFHLCWMNALQVRRVVDGVKKEGVERVAPCHCSGDLARRAFETTYGENFILVGVGRQLEIEGK